jgi:hypothetical protein
MLDREQGKIAAVQARKLIVRGDQVFLAFIVAPTEQAKKNLEDIPVVCEYPDVFSTDYSRLPPQRKVEFGIECVPGTNPISKAPYRMALSELKELKEQLQELLDKVSFALVYHCGEHRCCLLRTRTG